MLVQQFLENSAREFTEKVALVHGGARPSYREINEQSNRLAHALIAAGVGPGDRVAICMDNCPEAVIAIFAALKADAVFLLLNATVKSGKLAHILNHSRAAALITHDRKCESIRECWPQAPHLQLVCVTGDALGAATDSGKQVLSLDAILRESGPVEAPPTRNTEADLAALLYTSGSTAEPKGVMLTHGNISAAADSVTAYLENNAGDIILSVLPLFFGYGLYQVLMTFKCGGTVVLERSLAFPHQVLTRMGRERVTGLAIVPTVAAILLQLDLSKYDFSSLRYITNAGAALPVEQVWKFRKLLPHVKLFLMYGQTECIRTTYLPPEEAERRPDSVGKAMPGCEVYVVDDAGRHVAPGTVGELVVRGPNVMRGYWQQPQETAAVLRPGPMPGGNFLYSGDLFRADEEGYLYFVSRKDDLIKVRGQRVGPVEIEDAICRMGGVLQAAVIGVPDPILGSAIKAFVRLAPGAALSAQDVMAHCAAHLEDFMVPKFVEFCDALPATDSGKVNRKELRART